MRKYMLGILLAGSMALSQQSSAQVGIGIGVGPRMGFGGYGGGYGRPYPRRTQNREKQPKFTPIVNFSVGYGYPSLDKDQLASFYQYYRGPVSDQGAITGALDVQYDRTGSIGLLVSHDFLRAGYYDNADLSSPAAVNGTLENWSVMLNLVRYMPVSEHFSTYLRTAIGLNFWDERYKDPNGNKLPISTNPTQLAYQVGLGAKVYVSKNTGFFVEAGYGKYILHGGLTFRL